MRLQKEINQWEETLRIVLNENDKINEVFAGIGFPSKNWNFIQIGPVNLVRKTLKGYLAEKKFSTTK